MYAKMLMRGAASSGPVPYGDDQLRGGVDAQLLDRGWGPFDGPVPPAPAGRVVITHQRLQVIVEGKVLLDDLNPASPPGWWEAVDALGGGCAVVLTRTGTLDLTDTATVGPQLQALLDTNQAIWAVLPIGHDHEPGLEQ